MNECFPYKYFSYNSFLTLRFRNFIFFSFSQMLVIFISSVILTHLFLKFCGRETYNSMKMRCASDCGGNILYLEEKVWTSIYNKNSQQSGYAGGTYFKTIKAIYDKHHIQWWKAKSFFSQFTNETRSPTHHFYLA